MNKFVQTALIVYIVTCISIILAGPEVMHEAKLIALEYVIFPVLGVVVHFMNLTYEQVMNVIVGLLGIALMCGAASATRKKHA